MDDRILGSQFRFRIVSFFSFSTNSCEYVYSKTLYLHTIIYTLLFFLEQQQPNIITITTHRISI